MKKIYLTASLALIGMLANAQTTFKIANPAKKHLVHTEGVIHSNSTQAVAANIICNTQYTAGTTMDLNLTYTTTNGDGEYVDSLLITFPAGITPTGLGATSNPFPNTEDAGGGLEALDPINGQTISWGDNDNSYGGIFAANGIVFTVNVTIAPATTGNLVANFYASGDGFAAPAPATGSFTIYPVGAVIKNLQAVFVQPFNLTAINVCNYGVDTLIAKIKNLGNVADSNTAVTFTVNGTVVSTTVLPSPLAVGDSIFVPCLVPFDFTPSNAYALLAYTSVAGDINMGNDTAKLTFTNSISTPLTSTVYTNGIESTYDFASLSNLFVSGAGYRFGTSTFTVRTGSQALFYTAAANVAPGVQEAMVVLPCMDVTAGEKYRVTYWKRSNSTGMSALFTGLTNDVAGMSTVLKAYAAITPANTWIKDSTDFTASATETRYFAIGGKGTTTATVGINVRVDDIKVAKVVTTPVSVKNLTATTSGLYPNPATNNVTLTNVTVGEIVNVYNVLGSVVLTEKVTAINHTINITELHTGNYIVRVGNATPVRLTVAK